MPRCDLLVWILVTKLVPTYYRKLDLLLKESARYLELLSWHKGFKKIWRKLEETPITIPINDAYRPKVNEWICTCPAFAVSRFLVCKHLIQRVQRVPPVFFLEADRFREPPFWRHKSLRPLEEYRDETLAVAVTIGGPVEESHKNPDFGDEGDEDDADGTDFDDEDEDDGNNGTHQHDGSTFEEAMTANIDLILDMAAGLKHQLQFQDQQLLNALQ